MKEVASGDSEIEIDQKELQSAVRDAIRDSVEEAVQEVISGSHQREGAGEKMSLNIRAVELAAGI